MSLRCQEWQQHRYPPFPLAGLSLRLEEKDGAMAKIKVDEVLRLCAQDHTVSQRSGRRAESRASFNVRVAGQ